MTPALARKAVFLVPLIIAVSIVSLSYETDADQTGCARIGDTYFDDLALALSSAHEGDMVIVMDGCELSNDSTVKPGVTLMVPYSDGHSDIDEDGYTNGPDPTKTEGAYRKRAGDSYCVTALNIQKGVTLTVEGKVIIGGIISEKFTFDYQGHTWGDHGKIVLNGKMIMANGSELRSYGYIKGNGEVISENGSKVYEPFIITDFVGGDIAKDLYDDDQSPFNRYTYSNIQCDHTIKYGARLLGMATIYVQERLVESDINLVGTSSPTVTSLLELSYGSSMKISYDEKRCLNVGSEYWSSNIWKDVGTTYISIYGGAEFNHIMISYGGYAITTDNLEFSIPFNYVYELYDGIYTMKAGLRLLPGASLTIDDSSSLIVKKNLYVFNGLQDYPVKDKYYPGPELLTQFGFENHGSLIVNGDLIIDSGSVVGVIESERAEGRIIVNPAVTNYQNIYINYSTVNYTVRALSLWSYSDDGNLVVMKPGTEYRLTSGTSTSDGFQYYYDGDLLKKECEQTFYGKLVSDSPESYPVNVYLKKDGVDIEGATISLGGFELTYNDGRYTTSSLPDGIYKVKVKSKSFIGDCGEITIVNGKGLANCYLFTVTFQSDGSVIEQMVVPYDSTIEPPQISKRGYVLDSWYNQKGDRFSNDVNIRSLNILTANWVSSDYYEVYMDDSGEVSIKKSDIGNLAGVVIKSNSGVRIWLDKDASSYLDSTFKVSLSISDENYKITVSDKSDVLKTIALPYDTMRTGAKVESKDGSEIISPVMDPSSKTITFSSTGSSFAVTYDPEPTPIDSFDFDKIILIAAIATALVIATIIVVIVLFRRSKTKV